MAAKTKKRWLKRELTALLKEDKDGFYRLAAKYGLDTHSPTGRLRRSPAVMNEVIAAFKEKGYKAVPKADAVEETPAPAKKKASRKKKASAGEAEAPSQDGSASSAKPAAASEKKGKKKKVAPSREAMLNLFLGMATFVVAQERALLKMIKRDVTDVALGICLDTASLSPTQVKELSTHIFDEESDLKKQAGALGIDEDMLMELFLRIAAIGKEE